MFGFGDRVALGKGNHPADPAVWAVFYPVDGIFAPHPSTDRPEIYGRLAVFPQKERGRFPVCGGQHCAGRHDGGRQHHRGWCGAGAGRCRQHFLDVGGRLFRDDDQVHRGISCRPMAGAGPSNPLDAGRPDVLYFPGNTQLLREIAGRHLLRCLHHRQPDQRQHDPNQRHRPIALGRVFSAARPDRRLSHPTVRLGAGRRMRPSRWNLRGFGAFDVGALPRRLCCCPPAVSQQDSVCPCRDPDRSLCFALLLLWLRRRIYDRCAGGYFREYLLTRPGLAAPRLPTRAAASRTRSCRASGEFSRFSATRF